MHLNDFEKHIDSVILRRGLDYYEDGCVTELKELKKNEWSAVVEGTAVYHVKVIVADGRITSSKCDCPYDMGPVCKHEVAVYYTIRDGTPDKEENDVRETGDEKIKRLLGKLGKEELLAVIVEHALDNDRFYNYIVARYESTGKAESKTSYKKFIRSCLNAASDRYGFIDYHNAYDAAEGASRLITDAHAALNNKEYEKAIHIAQAVIEEMVPSLEYTDDSGGGAGSVIEDAFEILFTSAGSTLPQNMRKSLFSYCLRETDKKIYDDYGDWQYDFINLAVLASKSEDEMNLILRLLENNIKAESGEEYSSSYRIEKLSEMKLDLLIKMNRKDEAENFLIGNLHLPGFRRRALDEALKNKNYDRVIKLARDGEKQDGANDYYGLVREWKEWRFKAYTGKRDREGIQKLSYDFLVNHNDIKYYNAYKKSIPDSDWKDSYKGLKNILVKKSGNRFATILADILVVEKEFPALLAMLKEHPDYVTSFQRHFLTSHPKVIYTLHMKNIRNEAKRVDNRQRYKYVCGNIKNLKKIGGTEEAELLIKEFREIYNRRPAFQDELSKL
jgi:hypothetical protein